MTNIKADTAAIQTASSQFASQSVQLGDLLSQVTRDLNNLEPLWTGPAASQFVSLMVQWNTDVTNMRTVLEEVAQRVSQAGTGYADLDSAIQRSFTH